MPMLRCLFSFLLALAASLAASAQTPCQLCQRVDQLLGDTLFRHAFVGLYVYDLTADSLLVDRGATLQMRPASVMKTLTTTVALHRLGGSYQYMTRLYTTGSIKHHRLRGNLIVQGGYDPRVGAQDIQQFVQALRSRDIRRIKGRILCDVSLKDTLPRGWGWCWDDDDMRQTPLLYDGTDTFAPRLLAALDEAGIRYDKRDRVTSTFQWGTTIVDALPADGAATQIAVVRRPIDQVLVHMLKESDNTYAESLYYQLRDSLHGHYPSHVVPAGIITDFVRDSLHVSPSTFRIADGSGLSLYNSLTPQLVGRMLRFAYRHPEIYSHLYPALPVMGRDGTLKSRLRGTPAQGNVHAKTGSETGVSTLAGYCTTASGHQLCFAVFNMGQITSAPARHWQDRLVLALTTP